MTEPPKKQSEPIKRYLCPVCNRTTTSDTCQECGVGTRDCRNKIDGTSRFPYWVWIVVVFFVGIQSLMTLAALLAIIAGDETAPGLAIVFTLSIVATIVVVIVIFVLRLHLRERELLRRVKAKPGIGLTTVAITAMFSAILLVSAAMLIVNSCQTVFAANEESATAGAILRILAGLSYAGFFPLLALAVMAVGTMSFIEKLDRECPRPLFLNESKLAELAFRYLSDQIEIAGQAQPDAGGAGQGKSASAKPQRLGLERTARGGIKLIVRGRVRELEWDEKAQKNIERERIRDFVAETDEWGHIVSVRENNVRKPWEGRSR